MCRCFWTSEGLSLRYGSNVVTEMLYVRSQVNRFVLY